MAIILQQGTNNGEKKNDPTCTTHEIMGTTANARDTITPSETKHQAHTKQASRLAPGRVSQARAAASETTRDAAHASAYLQPELALGGLVLKRRGSGRLLQARQLHL